MSGETVGLLDLEQLQTPRVNSYPNQWIFFT